MKSAATAARRTALAGFLRRLGGAAVAFSGGVDSAVLLLEANAALGGRCIAVSARLAGTPPEDEADAASFCVSRGIRRVVVDFDELAVPGFADNTPERCYLCKRALFAGLSSAAASAGFATLCEGSNVDDRRDYRPGRRALAELGVLSPLEACGFTKADVREIARDLGVPFAEKPASPCLATRFAYGERITRERLSAVAAAERALCRLGCGRVRVRVHGAVARIETDPGDFHVVTAAAGRIADEFRRLGFVYTALDLRGYRTGSMNEVLRTAEDSP
ncbi:MAG: ATP-dependent sacrificial sulfur transferase LarE [Kiritimatiellae bacterium]|nr:ATP-dependent sacrificial sulfur transferase LarE [Kiritimatiellia bacterium]